MIRSRTVNRRLALLASALMLSPSSALANPLGGQVVGGQANIQGQGTNSVTVTQGTANAIINWNTFNIGAGERTQFIQPSATSIALNRVIGGLGASEIFGSLTANGRIFLVNPNGVLIGQGAVINASGFLATTHDISNADFMAGRYNFNIPGRPDASIVNLGNINITPSSSGFAALVAPGVRNAGVITADLGHVALASGNGFTLDFYGDKLITLQVNDQIANQVIDVATNQPLRSLVSNSGTLQANGGQVALTAVAARTVVDSVINTSGVIEANSVGTRNGMIVLGAATASTKGAGAPTQKVKISGTLSAKAGNWGLKGGTIKVTGESIELASAKLDASGHVGGGTVSIGGKNVDPSSTVTIDNSSIINASAGILGDGGNVTVWSNGVTSVTGTILATGGALAGNGGLVETSGETVYFDGIHVDTSAAHGRTGTWLIDPTDLIIDAGAAGAISSNLASNNVTLQTNGDGSANSLGDIVVNGAISWSSHNSLTLNAYHGIDINAPITISGAGQLNLSAANAPGLPSLPLISFNNGGNVQFTDPEHRGKLYIDDERYTLLYSMSAVQNINGDLDGRYALATSLDAGTFNGWTPIGTGENGQILNYGNGFLGTFQGLGNTVSNLTIKPGNESNMANIGLFGVSSGVIQNLNLANVSITVPVNPHPTNQSQYVGTLVGQNFGVVSNVTVADSTITAPGAGVIVGGLVGQNGGWKSQHFYWDGGGERDGPISTFVPGLIRHSSADVAVSIGDGMSCSDCGGWNYAGGLVGVNQGKISHSSAAGDVIAGSNSYAGGLVGANQNFFSDFVPRINSSFATGNVVAGPGATAGGLVGWNDGKIRKSHATGDSVTVGSDGVAGGLVGNNTGSIWRSFATDNVTMSAAGGGLPGIGFDSLNNGTAALGGLVGVNSGWIGRSHAGGTVGAGEVDRLVAGGLVGINDGMIWRSQATGNVTSLGTGVTLGGLVGINYGEIGRSHAGGNVSAMAASNASSDCSTISSCMTNTVGGLVGWNDGTIRRSSAGARGDDQQATVSVGSQGVAGGLVGFNDQFGQIWRSTATANVTGDPGVPSNQDVFNKVTILGGLVGQNQGFIGRSSASGAVGGTGDFLEVGGLVAKNNGTIWRSHATGDVTAGNFSSAGGLVAENNPGGQNCAGDCGPPGPAKISRSYATGSVTVGSDSLAAGLVAINQGTINHTRAGTAGSTVTAGDNSILGGLVAVNDLSGVIKNSSVFGAVASSPNSPNSVLGGFVGVNGGSIDNSQTAAAVTATSDSYVGGFVGVNIGSIIDSHVVDAASVTVTGGGNFVGGFVGMNIGLIDPSTTVVTPQTQPGTNNIVGGFAGANFDFANFTFPSGIQVPSFPTGTISVDSTTTDAVHPFIGTDVVASSPSTPPPPAPPSIVTQCSDALCPIILALPLTPSCTDASCLPPPQQPPPPPDNTNNNSPINTPPPIWQQIALFSPDNQPTQINLTTGGTGGTGGAGSGNSGNGGQNGNHSPGPPPGPGLGRTLSEQQFSGVPPIGEIRFLPGEIVMQISDTVSLADVQKIAAQFGITLISSQNIPGRVLYRFSFATNKDIRRLILALEHNNLVASVQPNYLFGLTQPAAAPAPATPQQEPSRDDTTGSIPPPSEAAPDLANSNTAALESLPVGDAAQYVIGKFHLGDVHRLARGRNVSVAVIDSEIDARHPDLAGVLTERYDATSTPSRPHAHGTGMAGAIASHTRLLGVAPGVRLLAIKAFDESASSAEATSFQILKGLDYAIAKNVRIINMSFAGPHDPMMERTLKTAHDKGIILIAAAGNAGPKSPPLYPGADPSVIAVTATDYTDKPFAMANRGKYVAVAAPGVDVMVPAPGGSYQLTTGTSVAAAHVSGVAALLVERKPTITPDEVRAILTRTARAFAALPKGEQDGAGMVDPVGALQFLMLGRSSEASPPARSASVH